MPEDHQHARATLVPAALAQTGTVGDVCGTGEDASLLCVKVFEATGNTVLARLADVGLARPTKIMLIVVLAFVATRVVRRVVKHVVRRLSGHLGDKATAAIRRTPLADTGPISPRRTKRAESVGHMLRSLGSAVVWVIAFTMILGELGINLGPLLAGAGIIGIALGFGSQTLVKDFLSGLFMLVEDQYGVDDVVNLGEASGVVEGVGLRTTRVRSLDGTLWHVPNGEIRRVGNLSQLWARVILDIGVAYDAELSEAVDAIQSAADEVARDPEYAGVVLEPPEVWGVEDLGADAVAIRVAVKVVPKAQWRVARALRRSIKRSLDEAGISIPFPQRTVWLHHEQGTSADAEASGARRRR